MSRKTGVRLSDLLPGAREQASRAISRELGKGNGPVPGAGKPVTPQSIHGPLTTWFKAAACYARIVPVQVAKVTPDRLTIIPAQGPPQALLRCEDRVRYFPSYDDAHEWVYGTIRTEINRLVDVGDELVDRKARHAEAAKKAENSNRRDYRPWTDSLREKSTDE